MTDTLRDKIDWILRPHVWPSVRKKIVDEILNSFADDCLHESRTIGDDGWFCNNCDYITIDLNTEDGPTIIKNPPHQGGMKGRWIDGVFHPAPPQED